MKPIASLSLDLDNQWSYMKTHGDAGWEAFPSYLDLVVDRFLPMLEERGLRITVFVVGQDAALDKNHKALRKIADAGHEIGNHSFHHEPWLHLYSEEQIEEEISKAEQAIEHATGRRPHGFRGPGFSISPTVLRVLLRHGYRYDCSTFPTFLGPLARTWYFLKSDLAPEEREKRKQLFGGWKEGLRSIDPYLWELAEGNMVEIPVTTVPVLRVPMHMSYVLYLSTLSPRLARAYFASAQATCRMFGSSPSLLLHPLDFLSGEDIDALAFFPGMALRAQDKLACVGACLDLLRRNFDILPLEEHAEALRRGSSLQLEAA
ncbi:MAG: polysaccharide deacetylase family protein [Deltaproteobacteria bacterium]|nr:polysaccharide deacetylase family protein [Deltaproteobacteria bacterium]